MNNYVVTFQTMDELEVGLLIKIEVSVNRPNNPDDDDLIYDYLKRNYGATVDYDTLNWHLLDSTVIITESYSIET